MPAGYDDLPEAAASQGYEDLPAAAGPNGYDDLPEAETLTGRERPNAVALGPIELLNEGVEWAGAKAIDAVKAAAKRFGTSPPPPFVIDLEKGTISQPQTQAPTAPGRPLFQFPTTTLDPEPNPLQRLAESTSTPGSLLTLPAGVGKHLLARAVQAYYGLLGTKGVADTGRLLADPQADPEAKRQALEALPLNVAMAAGGAHALGMPQLVRDAFGRAKPAAPPGPGLKPGEVSEFGGLQPIVQEGTAGTEKGKANATETRTQPEGDQPQYPGTAPGTAVPADEGQIRQGEGGPAGGRHLDAPSGHEQPLQEPPAGDAPGRAAVEDRLLTSAATVQTSEPSRILTTGLEEALGRREPIAAAVLGEFQRQAGRPFALPEGYQLEGEQWVYRAPGRRLTPEQAARENAQAMAELRAQKEGSTGDNGGNRGDVFDQVQPTERVEPGTPSGPQAAPETGTPAPEPSETDVPANVSPDVIERWFDDAIEAVKPGTGWTGQASLGLAKLPVWLGQEAATMALQAARAGYRLVRDLPQAIEAAVAHVRALNLPGFHEGELRAWLTGTLGERATGQKLLASEEVSEPVKTDIRQYLYERRQNATDQELADGMVRDLGLDRAQETLLNPPAELPGSVRSKLLGSVTRELAHQERLARGKGEVNAADALARRQGELWDRVLPQITDMAQSLQAMRDIIDMSPEGQVARVKAQLERQAQNVMDGRAPEVETVRGALEQGQKRGIEEVRQDPAVNGAARAAVDEHVAGSEETRKAVIMDLAEGWSESPAIVAHARELVRSRANQLLGQNPLPFGRTAVMALRGIMDDLAKRAAGIAAGYFQGAAAHRDGLTGLYQERLGLDAAHAKQLAARMDAEFARQVDQARKTLPKRIARQRGNLLGKEDQKVQDEVNIRQGTRGVWSREKQVAAETLTGAIKQQLAPDKPKTALQEFAGRLAQRMRQQILEQLPEKAPKPKLDDMQVLREALQNADKYMEVWWQTQHEVSKQFADKPAMLEKLNAIFEKLAPDPLKTSTVDKLIRQQLKEMNAKLGDLLRSEVDRRDATGQHVAERIVDASGLQGEAADTLRTTLQTRWDALVTAAQRRTLEQMQRTLGVTVRGPMKDAFTRLVELNRLGALTSERFYDVVKKALKLKELTDADAKVIRSLVEKAQEQPEGFLRERAEAQVLQTTQKLAGNTSWWDVPMAMWYTNAVSGLTTYAKIPLENSNMYLANLVSSLLSRPGELLHPLGFARATAGAVKRGLAKGALQAEGTLRTGVVTGVWERPRSNLLEAKPFGETLDKVNFWKYLARLTSTAHEATFKPAWEFKQTMLAREAARREGLKGAALDQRVADLMANTDQAVAQARGQAVAELTALGRTKGTWADRADLARRTGEILEQRREVNMPGSTATARDYALRTVYLNEPYGAMGVIADGVNGMLRQLRKQAPVTGTLAKAQIPFVRVASNILNEAWNWGPGGLQRAALSHWTGKLYGRPMMEANERAEMYAKGIAGTVAVGTLAALYGEHLHGNGPSDPGKRKQLQAQGWIPNSVEYHGRYYSVMNTPAKFWLTVLGNYQDWQRYGKGDEADAASRLAFAAKATSATLLNQGMLDSVRRILEAMGDENTGSGGQKLEQALARTASTFVVPNLAQQLDRIWDPTVYDKTGMGALVSSQIPVVRRGNRPALNVLGEPVQSGPFHYWTSAQSQDPVWRLLADKQAFVPEPSKSAIVGSRAAGPGYYRALTPDEHYDMVQDSGRQLRTTLEQNLPQLQAMPPSDVQTVVRMLAEQYHAAAKAKLANGVPTTMQRQ